MSKNGDRWVVARERGRERQRQWKLIGRVFIWGEVGRNTVDLDTCPKLWVVNLGVVLALNFT